jgi:hypothetical protein
MRFIMRTGMAERCFSAHTVIERSPEEVFAWVSDHRNAARVLHGVSRWEPRGPQVSGRGARFDVEMRALGFPLSNVLVLDTWDEPRAIGWRSESGLVAQAGGWRFRPVTGRTEVTLTIRYRPPGGPLAGLVAGQVDGVVRRRLDGALARMKAILEDDR